jgi:hypothetical protein
MPAASTRVRGGVRALQPEDIGAVAKLFQKRFRDAKRPVPASLASYLSEIFFAHPWRDPDIPSRVHVSSEGVVDGFIGVFPSRMHLGERAVRAAIAGSLMVDQPEKNPFAGARLLHAFCGGPQDISISETCNPLTQSMWSKLGGQLVPLTSMEWYRILRPAGTVTNRLPAARLLRPLAALADVAVKRVKTNPFRLDARASRFVRGEDADEASFVDCTLRLSSEFAFGPSWSRDSLRWLLRHAEQKEDYGKMVRRLVYGPGPEPIGGYIYYGRPSRTAWVLQVFAARGHAGRTLDSLLAHALENGAVAVRGQTHPLIMGDLLSSGCVFLHRNSTMVHSRDDKLVDAAESSSALMTGLAGETWTRLIGGVFC